MHKAKNLKKRHAVNWLNRILNGAPRTTDAPTHSTGFYDIDGKPVPLSSQGENVRIAREMVRAAAIRTAQAFGIPAQWLSYEVVTISDEEKAYFQLQVSLRFWDEQLWSQSMAFEQQVYKRIREDDVNVARAVRAVLWRVLPEAGCPYDELAEPTSWKPEAVKTRAQAYERLRREIATPPPASVASTALPSVVTGAEASETLPLLPNAREARDALADQFGDTRPSSFGGFAATQPFDPDHPPGKS
jgi:hypothetical protein